MSKKCLSINSTKEVKDLYTENYKTNDKGNWRWFKEMERYSKIWIGRIHIVKMTNLPKQSIDFKQPLSKYPLYFSQN